MLPEQLELQKGHVFQSVGANVEQRMEELWRKALAEVGLGVASVVSVQHTGGGRERWWWLRRCSHVNIDGFAVLGMLLTEYNPKTPSRILYVVGFLPSL